MSGFVAQAKVKDYEQKSLTADIEKDAQKDEQITNNGFFPDLSLLEARNYLRVDGAVTNPRLKVALIDAMATVNQSLKKIKQNHVTFADIEAEQIAGESILIQRYKRAVYALTLASLNERYRNYDTTNSGGNNADDIEENIDDLKRDAHFAIRDILGDFRLTVELI